MDTIVNWLASWVTWDNLGDIIAWGLAAWFGLALVVGLVVGKSIAHADREAAKTHAPTSDERFAEQAEESSVLG